MAANKRTAARREQDLSRVAELYLRGRTQSEIGQELGVSRQQISYDLKVLQKRWQEAALSDFSQKKAQELAKIDALERAYWQAWQDSKRDRGTTTTATEKSGGAEANDGEQRNSSRMKASMRKEERDGNPEFLKGVERCINRRCAILGLDAPQKSELSGPNGKALAKVYLGFDIKEV
jgi:hypothetical protein